jgi:hypothetical protein
LRFGEKKGDSTPYDGTAYGTAASRGNPMIRAILVGLAAAAGTLLVAAVGFAILDIYLSGHGRPSPMKLPVGPYTSGADLIALGLSLAAGVVAGWKAFQR